MKFRTQYTEIILDAEKDFPPTETDGSQNETVAQMVKRFTSSGIVIPPAVFEEEKEEDVEAMLRGEKDDLTEADDFDYADAALALAEAEEVTAELKKILAAKTTPKAEKSQEEPKKAQETAAQTQSAPQNKAE